MTAQAAGPRCRKGGSPHQGPTAAFRHRQKRGTRLPEEVEMTNTSVDGAVDRATNSKAFEYAARAGFAASGTLHLLVAFIILRLAFGSGGNADQSGALSTLAKQPGGAVM